MLVLWSLREAGLRGIMGWEVRRSVEAEKMGAVGSGLQQ